MEFSPRVRVLKNLLKYFFPLILFLFFLSMMKYSAARVPWYERMLWNLVAPLQHGFHAISSGVDQLWSDYIALRGVRHENLVLYRENQALAQKLVAFEEMRQQNERLKLFMDYRGEASVPSVVARVIASNARAEFRTLVIDKGAAAGVRMYMPVLGVRGAVGRISKVFARESVVLLLDDPNSTVDAMIQRSRLRGLLVGNARSVNLLHGASLSRLEYLDRQSDIAKSDIVITSGLDRIFPPGIPVGTVEEVRLDKLGIFREAEVVPFEHFFEIQEVLVLQYSPEELEFQ